MLIEGNSFLDYVTPDLAIMCARSDGGKVKPSARHALEKSDVLYLSSLSGDGVDARKQFDEWRTSLNIELDFDWFPILTREDLPRLISLLPKEKFCEQQLVTSPLRAPAL